MCVNRKLGSRVKGITEIDLDKDDGCGHSGKKLLVSHQFLYAGCGQPQPQVLTVAKEPLILSSKRLGFEDKVSVTPSNWYFSQQAPASSNELWSWVPGVAASVRVCLGKPCMEGCLELESLVVQLGEGNCPYSHPCNPYHRVRWGQLGENRRSGFINTVGPPPLPLCCSSEVTPTLNKVSRLQTWLWEWECTKMFILQNSLLHSQEEDGAGREPQP